jgi:uncharacterized protein DUF5674
MMGTEEVGVAGAGGVEEDVAMRIHLLDAPAEPWQITEMLEALGDYIKAAVDVERRVLAGGGKYHADCEAVLLEDGSMQQNIWGAGWAPSTGELRFEAMLNIQPRRGNPSMMILDPEIQARVRSIIVELLGLKP